MSDITYEKLVEQYKDTVVLRLRGMFYNAFDESAFVLGELLGYKVKRTGNSKCKVGFPSSGLEKVIEQCKNTHVNVIAFDGNDRVEQEIFEDNQFQSVLKDFDINMIEEAQIKGQMEEVPVLQKAGSVKQRTSFIQGQGINLESAIIDIQRTVDKLIESGKKVISLSFVENDESGKKDVVLVQGIVIYEISMEV